MSSEISTQEAIYEAIFSALRKWKEQSDLSTITVPDVVDDLHLRAHLARLEKESRESYQILDQRFRVGKSAKEIRPRSPDSIYHKQRKAINQLASWIIEDEDARRIASAREHIQTQMGVMPPPSYTKLIGVQQRIVGICEHIALNTSPHITLITGLGGIGKTATTDAVIRQVIQRRVYEHVVWVRHVASTMHGRSRQSSDPLEQLMGAIAKLPHIDAAALPETERNRRIMTALREAPHLIIFDNLEEIEEVEATLARISNYVNPSHFVITSRTLPQPQQSGYVITLPELDDETSLELLRHESVSNNVENLAGRDDDALVRIVSLVGGNPLALKITVGMARHMPFEQLLADLQQGHTSRSRKMYQNVYRAAWNSLSDDARSTLQGMVLAADGGVTADQIRSFSQIADSGRFWDAIEQLHHRHLLEMRHGERYGIHRLTATFLRTDVLGML